MINTKITTNYNTNGLGFNYQIINLCTTGIDISHHYFVDYFNLHSKKYNYDFFPILPNHLLFW